jgi:Protein of unknown function (DUF3450)
MRNGPFALRRRRSAAAVLPVLALFLPALAATAGSSRAFGDEEKAAAAAAQTEKPSAPGKEGASLEEAIAAGEEGNRAAAQAQALIESLSDDIDRLAGEYRRTLQESQALEVYDKQLEDLLQSQEAEVGSLHKQIDDVSVVQRQIMPLMLRMIDTLDRFVELDVPFQLVERRERVAKLRQLMDRADVTLAEKYRRLMEAYQIENEFGRTIEAYRGTLDADGSPRTVDFLRVGRIALLYQTLDARETGAWDREGKKWIELDDEYRSSVRQGLRIARKQVAPDLLYIPVSAPREAR